MTSQLPLFTADKKTAEILREVISAIPDKTNVFLYGGAARNAVFYKIHNEKLRNRDFDLILIGNKNKFIKNLLKLGFDYGKTRKKTKVVLKKSKINNPKNFSDYVYLDIYISDTNESLKEILSRRANFRINGLAIELRNIIEPNWFKTVTYIPGALVDLKAKKLNLKARFPINIYALLRFVHLGFKPPVQKEIKEMLDDWRNIDQEKFLRDTKKVLDYVGGLKTARKILSKLNIRVDIFDFENTNKIDLIIILGGGINKNGKISDFTKERLNTYLVDKEKFLGIPILLSGRWSGTLKNTMGTPESTAMKIYLEKRQKNVKFYTEAKSLDTISNAIFSLEIVKKHKNWKNILLITSDWHMKRSIWIFQEIFGSLYKIRTLSAPFAIKNTGRNNYENHLLKTTKTMFKKIPTYGWDWIKFLKNEHPFYSKSKASQELLRKILIAQEKFLNKKAR